MAKAKDITGLDCAADALEWATEVLRVRFEEMIDQRGAALDFEDTEGVHAMRVATRRLRSALQDFEPLMKKPLSKKLRKEIKSVADALGGVRDQDVAIHALEKLHAKTETGSLKNGLETFIKERNVIRDSARLDLTEAIAISKINGLQERFSQALDKIAAQRSAKRAISFNEAGREAVAGGLKDLINLGESLYHPFQFKELHRMRIAAKRLRYAVELFTACWGEAIVPFAGEIAEMQGFLGEAHDCDVWIKSLGERLVEEQEDPVSKENDYQTSVWLLSKFVKKRTKNYRSALKLWRKWQTERFTGRMQSLIRTTE